MRLAVLTTLAAIAVAGCDIDTGFGPQVLAAPPERLIQLDVEWPLARSDVFINARWILEARYADEEDTVGEIDPSGRFAVEYVTACYEGEETGVLVWVKGRFESASPTSRDCSLLVPDKCVSGIQRIVISESDRQTCQPPGG